MRTYNIAEGITPVYTLESSGGTGNLNVTSLAHITDGDTSTVATFVPTPASDTYVATFNVTIDIGTSTYLTTIYNKYMYTWVNSTTRSNMHIAVSNDASSWTILETFSTIAESSATPVEITYTVDGTYRYIKYYGTLTGYASTGYEDFYIYECMAMAEVVKVNSGLAIMGSNNKGIRLAAEASAEGPLRFNRNGTVTALYLVDPSDSDATGLRIQCSPTSAFVESILGSGSDGILSIALWSYFMSTTLKLLNYSFGSTSSYLEFGDADDNHLFYVVSITATVQSATIITLPVEFNDANWRVASCKTATADGAAILPEITEKYNSYFVAYTASGTSSSPGSISRQFDFILIGA